MHQFTGADPCCVRARIDQFPTMQLLRTDPPSSDFADDCHCMFPVVVGRIERWRIRSNRLKKRPAQRHFLPPRAETESAAKSVCYLAGRSGFEPRLPGPEPGVPPLNYCPSASTRRAITTPRPGPQARSPDTQCRKRCDGTGRLPHAPPYMRGRLSMHQFLSLPVRIFGTAWWLRLGLFSRSAVAAASPYMRSGH